MRKLWPIVLLAALAALWPVKAKAQTPVSPSCRYGFTFTTTGRSTAFNNVTPPGLVTVNCSSWTLIYSVSGFSAVNLEVDSAPDNVAPIGTTPGSWTIWPASQIAAGQTMPLTLTTNAVVTFYGWAPWLSIQVNTATCPGGTVCQGVVYLYGWQTQGSQESNTGATQVQGIVSSGSAATSGNPIQIALNAPTKPWDCALAALVASLTQCQAAPAAGRLYITDITVVTTTATAGTWAVEFGTGTNCGTGTTKLFPSLNGPATWTAPVTGAPQKLMFATPLQPAALNAICVIGTATNTINVELEGFVAN